MLLQKIQQKWRYFVSILAVSISLALGISYLLPEKFEAKVTVRSATVGQIGQGQGQALGRWEVETNTQTLTRLSSPRFYTDAILATCSLSSHDAAEKLSKVIKVSIVKTTTDLTTISYTAKGQEQTRICLQAIIDQLARSQEELASGRKKQLQVQLASQQEATQEMEKIDIELRRKIASNGLSNKSPSESALILYELQSKQNLLREARRAAIDLAAALEPPMTQKLKTLESIYTSVDPVFPNRLLFGFVGLFLGLVICALYCWREIVQILQPSDQGD